MKVLVYLNQTGCVSPNGQHIDMAIQEVGKGNEVFFLCCDNSIGLCLSNPSANKLLCSFCKNRTQAEYKKYAPKGQEFHWMKEFVDKIDVEDLPVFNYHNAEELRSLTYDGIDIGFGVMSSYISLTRNLNPKIDDISRQYFDALIREQIVTLEVLKYLQAIHGFGLFIFQNGRGAQLKPFLNFCQTRNIDFWCTEDFARPHNFINNYWCDIPHSIKARTRMYMECWDGSKEDETTKLRVAESFYKNRRNSILAADWKVYTKNQQTGLMPDNWNENIENIVIFNSSEDEFCAVSHEYDDYALFESQIDGIKAIVEHYKDDRTKHFTLRVHPNLNNIPYKYHQDLYRLNYPNLTVIPGTAPVSTYALMDAASKIIVFGSSTGIEASYWGKPVICLAASLYKGLDVTYDPISQNELWQLLDTKNLPTKRNDNVYKYSYFYVSENHERTKYVDIDLYDFVCNGHRAVCMKYQKILGSNMMYLLIRYFFDKVVKWKWPAVFRKLPSLEA